MLVFGNVRRHLGYNIVADHCKVELQHEMLVDPGGDFLLKLIPAGLFQKKLRQTCGTITT